jgi:hypothetical protein
MVVLVTLSPGCIEAQRRVFARGRILRARWDRGGVVGRTSLFGGRGSIWGGLGGAFFGGILNNGLNLFRVSPYDQLMVKGAVLLVGARLARDGELGVDRFRVFGLRSGHRAARRGPHD